jgi:O-phosphoseryl-tRNA(Cys) synthetase
MTEYGDFEHAPYFVEMARAERTLDEIRDSIRLYRKGRYSAEDTIAEITSALHSADDDGDDELVSLGGEAS